MDRETIKAIIGFIFIAIITGLGNHYLDGIY